jgi:hypothetical protein
MSTIKIGLYLALLLLVTNIFAQEDGSYRNENWQPQNGKYYFSNAITWHYQKQTQTENFSGTISIYLDIISNTFLLTPKDYGFGEEMIDFILIEKSGRVIVAYADDSGKHLKKFKFNNDSLEVKRLTDFFKTDRKVTLTHIPLPQKQVMIYQKKPNINFYIEEFATVKTNMDFEPLECLRSLNLEFPIPSILTENKILNKNELLVFLCTKNEQLAFLDWLPNEYFVDLKGYK